MYHLHYTPGVVLAARSAGEADRRYRILTRELGVVTATARGVRVLPSKLRYALQTYSRVELVLVRGGGGWRIANAVSDGNVYALLSGRPRARAALTRSLRLIDRLLPGEERHEELFDAVAGGLSLLLRETTGEEDAQDVELLLVLRVLSLLGYVGDQPDLSVFAASSWTSPVLLACADRRADIASAINRAITESHL